jgi:hypothetical protein
MNQLPQMPRPIVDSAISRGRRPGIRRGGAGRRTLAALVLFAGLLVFAPVAPAAGAGTITGTVTHAAAPLEKVEVKVFDAKTEAFVGSASTNATGEYTATVSPGSYKVGFFPASGSKFITQYYNKAFSLSTAEAVTVLEGKATEHINAELGEGGTISGTVTDAHGVPLANISVSASTETSSGGSAITLADGKYTLAGLAPGSYTVGFFPAFGLNFVPQYYNGAASFREATPVLVEEEKTKTINPELQVGGEISGRVTDAVTHKPLANVAVFAEDARGLELFGFALTNANGEYTMVGLASATYNLEFFSENEGGAEYIAQIDNGVGVTQGSTTSGINAALVPKAPNNTSPPVASGTAAVGQKLSCSTGSWTGQPKPTYAYTWLRAGSAIGGATGSSYVVQAADQSNGLSCKVTASNKHGGSSATSNTLNVPPPPPPPAPAIVVSTSRLVARRGLIPLLVGCMAAPCKGSIEVTEQIVVKTHRKGKHGRRKTISRKETVVLATGSFSLAPGQSATIDLSLTGKGRSALARARRHRLSAKLLASVTGGASLLKPVLLSEVVKPKRKGRHR